MIMKELYQTVAAGDLKSRTATVFEMAENGPVVVMSRATPKAVMVTPDEWNATARLIQDLQGQLDRERRLRVANQRYAEQTIDASRGVSQDEFDEMLANMGLSE